MPRKARIDAPGALNHVIARGIEKRDIFWDDHDRNNFLERLGTIIDESGTRCYAWALLPNHCHLLFGTGLSPIATVMRRLLTGYAVTFNRRHRRYGHLFQNRYKSILCQEEVYLKELVRYIHLNPLRAKIVDDLKQLDSYAFCGHSALMGRVKRPWQEVNEVLGMFAAKRHQARGRYRSFVEKGIQLGRRKDLTGGSLLRSVGGWLNVKALRDAKILYKSDERILGDSDFVESVLANANEQMERKYALQAAGLDLDGLAEIVAGITGVKPSRIFSPGKKRSRVRARSLLCFWATRELGITLAELSRRTRISQSSISMSVHRGEQIAEREGYSLLNELKLKNRRASP
ncbi:MAG: transposase [Desulfobacterales bacterium]|nr:MAG: transposase [Desulfobacterales bacterium]